MIEAVHKNNSVSGRAAGWLKKVRLETLFSFLQEKYFPTNKKKGGFFFLRPPDWLQF